MARVVRMEANGRGALSLAGALVEAQLPKDVREGAQLRLVVREITPTRVVLGLSDPASPVPPPPQAVPLPSGGTLRITDHEPGRPSGAGADPGVHSLALRYDAPRLGAVDLRFELDRASLRLAVTVAAGEAHALGQARAAELRDALAAAVDRAVTVTVSPRQEPVDVYA